MRLLEQGRSTAQIAEELHISTETARNHIRRLFRALGVHSRLEALQSHAVTQPSLPAAPPDRPFALSRPRCPPCLARLREVGMVEWARWAGRNRTCELSQTTHAFNTQDGRGRVRPSCCFIALLGCREGHGLRRGECGAGVAERHSHGLDARGRELHAERELIVRRVVFHAGRREWQ